MGCSASSATARISPATSPAESTVSLPADATAAPLSVDRLAVDRPKVGSEPGPTSNAVLPDPPVETRAIKLSRAAETPTSFISLAVEKVNDMELPEGGAGFFAGIAATHGSELADVLARLESGAIDILQALKPAASIAGPVLVVAELALKQVLLWHTVSENCEQLRASIVALTPLVEEFAASDGLSSRHGALLIAAGRWVSRYYHDLSPFLYMRR
jgi:hypothetical protein